MMLTSAAPVLRRTRHTRLRPAFTLLEVLVVMAILVILAGATAFGTFKYIDMAKRSEAKTKMRTLETAAKTYYITYNEYPTDPMQLVQPSPDGTAPLVEGGEPAALDPWNVPFTMEVITDDFGSTRVRITSTGSGQAIVWPDR